MTIFDWPQAVPTDHENADEFLRRDLENILGYFRRKYPRRLPEDLDADSVADSIVDGSFDTVFETNG